MPAIYNLLQGNIGLFHMTVIEDISSPNDTMELEETTSADASIEEIKIEEVTPASTKGKKKRKKKSANSSPAETPQFRGQKMQTKLAKTLEEFVRNSKDLQPKTRKILEQLIVCKNIPKKESKLRNFLKTTLGVKRTTAHKVFDTLRPTLFPHSHVKPLSKREKQHKLLMAKKGTGSTPKEPKKNKGKESQSNEESKTNEKGHREPLKKKKRGKKRKTSSVAPKKKTGTPTLAIVEKGKKRGTNEKKKEEGKGGVKENGVGKKKRSRSSKRKHDKEGQDTQSSPPKKMKAA